VTHPTRATEFIDLFNEIEKHFRTALGRSDRESFTSMASAYVERERLPRSIARDLGTFADLRNVISHNRYYDSRPIAEPTPGVVTHLRQIRDTLLSPPTVLAVLGSRKVTAVQAGDPLRAVLHLVRSLNYSQFPVYDGTTWLGLITTNAIARWIAQQVDDQEVFTGDESVQSVLACSEEQDAALHVGRTISAPEAIHLLGTPLRGGARPAALVVTQNGRPTETALAVVVDEDLSVLHHALDIPAAP